MNKVESISDLLDFFTSSPLEKIKENFGDNNFIKNTKEGYSL